jgi:hypothetical protein
MLRKIVVAASSLTLLIAAPAHAQSRLEPASVTKVTFDAAGDAQVRVNVGSGGCTRATDFRVIVVTRPSGAQALRFERIGQDVCEAFAPQGTMIDLAVHGLKKGDPVFVENPLFVSH